MKKSKISILQILRLLIQIVFFIFLPSLYINTFAGIKQIYSAIVHQNVALSQLIPQLVEVVAIIPFTIIMGRFFCGWMCAFGAFGDFIYTISSKLFDIDYKMDESTDRALKYVKYVLLVFLIFVLCTFNITAFSSFNPWDAFGMLATVGKVPNFSYVALNLTAGFIIFVFIAVGSMFIERFFCRYLCPLGAVFAITSRLKIAKIRKTRTKCGNCRICTNNCAMGIPLYKYDVVNSGECINCMKCIKACPRKNTTFTVSGDDVRPLLAGAAAVTVMTGLYYAGNLGVSATGLNNVQVEAQSSQGTSNSLYKDGTYEGSGQGFRRGTTTVSVVVKNGKISDITALSNGDDRPFFSRAYNTVVQEIINNQSTEVNAVSGATFSSNGIMEAVADALSNAKISTDSAVSSSGSTSNSGTQAEASDSSSSQNSSTASENSQTQVASSNSGNSQSSTTAGSNQQDTGSQTAAAESSSVKYKDGTYEGSGQGFRGGTTTVSVVVKNGKITNVTTVSYDDDRRFYSNAFNRISQEIISSQSSEVDAVSGATYSSRGIMEAVQNALSQA